MALSDKLPYDGPWCSLCDIRACMHCKVAPKSVHDCVCANIHCRIVMAEKIEYYGEGV